MNSGVYIIFNSINNKFYIGSSFYLKKRFSAHILSLSKGQHHSEYLQRSWDKYGSKSFVFAVIELCEKDKCKEREQYYIDTYNPKYNICVDAIAVMAGRKHKPETLEKFKLRKGSKWRLGKKWTEHEREAILKARKESGYKHPEKTKEKMRQTALRKNRGADLIKSIEKMKKKVCDSQGNIFNSLVEAAKFWNMSVQAVCDVLKGRTKKTRNGITFSYV